MRWIVFVLFGVLVSGCSSKYDLGEMIAEAVAAGESGIVIPDGYHVIDEAIVMDGVTNFNISGDTLGRSVITSGMRLSLDDFECVDEAKGIYEISLPELQMEAWPDAFRGYAGWPELSVNGEPLILARYPNTGYLTIDSLISQGSIPRNEDTTAFGGAFISNEMAAVLTAGAEIYLGGYWCYKWYDEFMRVESVDATTGKIQMAAPHRYGLGGPSGGLFYGINQLAFLDQAGEYFYDRKKGTIRFIMPEGLTEGAAIEISFLDFSLFELRDCQNVRFEHLCLSNHNGLAFDITDSDSVHIVQCEISLLAQAAVKITGGSHCGVNASSISHIGATAVYLDGGDRQKLSPSKHFVTESHIHLFARHIKTYAPAVDLSGVGQIVAKNRISDAPHNAILFRGNDHLIVKNDIRRVCWDTSDAGAIYCGRDWTLGGTVIRQNSFEDLGQASHHHNWAIYLDDLASGIDVADNVIVNCPSGILVGGGRYNRIIGNEIRNCPKASIMYDARGLNWYQPYLKDPKHTLWTNLDSVPVDQRPWSQRFPWLQLIAADEPALPKAVKILDNLIVNSHDPEIHPSVRAYGTVQDF